jgi:hypothetical protein
MDIMHRRSTPTVPTVAEGCRWSKAAWQMSVKGPSPNVTHGGRGLFLLVCWDLQPHIRGGPLALDDTACSTEIDAGAVASDFFGDLGDHGGSNGDTTPGSGDSAWLSPSSPHGAGNSSDAH